MIVCNIHRFLQFLIIEVFYRAEKREKKTNDLMEPLPVKPLLILFSCHHKNTEKIANVLGKSSLCTRKNATAD
jgi:hypothetical protein